MERGDLYYKIEICKILNASSGLASGQNFEEEWNEGEAEYIAKTGRMDLILWIHEKKLPMDWKACAGAVCGGHFDMLKWLVAHDYPCGECVCIKAACCGQLEMLKWLVEVENIPLPNRVMSNASAAGQIEVLKWLKEKGCVLNENCMISALMGRNRDETLKWLYDNGCPHDREKLLRHIVAMKYGTKEQLIRQAGKWLNKRFDQDTLEKK